MTDVVVNDKNDAEEGGPTPTIEEVLQCQVSSWYPTFSQLPRNGNSLRRTRATCQTRIIDLPPEFREYLLTDGLRLPAGSKTSSFLTDGGAGNNPDEWSSDDGDGDDSEVDGMKNDQREGEADEAPSSFSFPELDQKIGQAIDELGGGGSGGVAPKLNWSCPKDAVWMNGGSLKCQTPGDVYLLLKSSDFCLYDLQHALSDVRPVHDDKIAETESRITVSNPEEESPPKDHRLQLALRKWCNLYPSQEFRCFVRGHKLVAISQRHHSQHFPYLVRDQYLIKSILVEFFDEIVFRKFAGGAIPSYVYDCYLDQKEKVWILDFNVWGKRTDTLLFEWSELEALGSQAEWNEGEGDVGDDLLIPEFRIVEAEKQVRADPLASYRAPIDTVHVASMTGGDAKKFEEFMKLCERPSLMAEDIDSNK